MNKWHKILLKTMLALTLTITSIYFFAPWEFALYYAKPLPGTIEEQVQDATLHGLDGIIVYVHKKNNLRKTYVSGWHDRQNEIPAYPKNIARSKY